MRTFATAAGAVLLTVVMALGVICHSQPKKAGRQYSIGRLSITVPQGWERKPGELAFRTGTNTDRFRFIAVSEEPLARGMTPSHMAELLHQAVLGTEGMTRLREMETRIDGKQAQAIEFRRVVGSKPAIRGRHVTVPLKDSVVTVFWYVREADWERGRKEMDGIVKTVRIK